MMVTNLQLTNRARITAPSSPAAGNRWTTVPAQAATGSGWVAVRSTFGSTSSSRKRPV